MVIAFSFALAAALLSAADAQLSTLSVLQKASVAKSGMDSMATWTNMVYLQGNASQEVGTVFIPQNSACFILNTTFTQAGGPPQSVYQCDVDPTLSGRVNSADLYASQINMSLCPITISDFGWYSVQVTNNASIVDVNCTQEA
jgi:hypothetical protein